MRAKVPGSKLMFTFGDHQWHWAPPQKLYDWKGAKHDEHMPPATGLQGPRLFKIAGGWYVIGRCLGEPDVSA